jgi:hypothetical protein
MLTILVNHCVLYSNEISMVGKIANCFVMPVSLSAWNNSAPPGRIFMKFVLGTFLENLLRKFKFH